MVECGDVKSRDYIKRWVSTSFEMSWKEIRSLRSWCEFTCQRGGAADGDQGFPRLGNMITATFTGFIDPFILIVRWMIVILQLSGVVVLSATPQPEGCRFDSRPASFLCALCMFTSVCWLFCRFSSFLPLSKNMHMRLTHMVVWYRKMNEWWKNHSDILIESQLQGI